MADIDLKTDITPVNRNQKPTGPTISALKTAITGSGAAASYPAATLQKLTRNDLVYICKLHGISVVGL